MIWLDDVSFRTPAEQPVVLTMVETLTRRSARRVSDVVRLLPRPRQVVVDVTAIPGFDSDGLSELMELREEVGPEQVIIVGLREATARLVGAADLAIETSLGDADTGVNRLRRMPGVILITAEIGSSAVILREALETAVGDDAAIVIVDLANFATLSADALDAIAFASTQVAMAGQELVLLNVSEQAAEILRHAGLGPTTYVASAI